MQAIACLPGSRASNRYVRCVSGGPGGYAQSSPAYPGGQQYGQQYGQQQYGQQPPQQYGQQRPQQYGQAVYAGQPWPHHLWNVEHSTKCIDSRQPGIPTVMTQLNRQSSEGKLECRK